MRCFLQTFSTDTDCKLEGIQGKRRNWDLWMQLVEELLKAAQPFVAFYNFNVGQGDLVLPMDLWIPRFWQPGTIRHFSDWAFQAVYMFVSQILRLGLVFRCLILSGHDLNGGTYDTLCFGGLLFDFP